MNYDSMNNDVLRWTNVTFSGKFIVIFSVSLSSPHVCSQKKSQDYLIINPDGKVVGPSKALITLMTIDVAVREKAVRGLHRG